MKISWVIGMGGLLGGELIHQLRNEDEYIYYPNDVFNWGDCSLLANQIKDSVKQFECKAINLKAISRWQIIWAAGVGSMTSNRSEFQAENIALEALVKSIHESKFLKKVKGCLVFASSAGAIYSGVSEIVIDENTEPRPIVEYGKNKLEQESMLTNFTKDTKNVNLLIVRISTLYGPNQSPNKKQGLITHIAKAIIRKEVIRIYVPLDTMRDYINVENAVNEILRLTEELKNESERIIIRIIAENKSVTISEILSNFNRITRKKILYIRVKNNITSEYKNKIAFNSIYKKNYPKKLLGIGIKEIYNSELINFIKNKNSK
jgi:UDP-glucose 4-epimerase